MLVGFVDGRQQDAGGQSGGQCLFQRRETDIRLGGCTHFTRDFLQMNHLRKQKDSDRGLCGLSESVCRVTVMTREVSPDASGWEGSVPVCQSSLPSQP